ncbi:MAG: sigma factor-like helix-turn-helix DNA-binding protein [Bdellovibrionota bacterium]
MKLLKEKMVVHSCDLKVPVDQYMQLLEIGLAQLSPQERKAIYLRFWEPFSIAEVARRMGLSWDEADLLIDQAVGKLRIQLKKGLS